MVDILRKQAVEQESSIPRLSSQERLMLIGKYLRRDGQDNPHLGWVLDLLEEADRLEPESLAVIDYKRQPKNNPFKLAEEALERGRIWGQKLEEEEGKLVDKLNELARMGPKLRKRHR